MESRHSYFDCFATVGPRHRMETGERYTLDQLLESMDRCGIGQALTGSTLGIHYDPMWANRRFLADLAPFRQRLFPLWTAAPHQTGECPAPAAFVKQAQAAGVRAVRIYPRTQAYPATPPTLGPLMKALARTGLPLFIHRDQFAASKAEEADGFARLDRFLADYPGNRIAVLGLSWTDYRYVWPLLERHGHWAMDFSSFQANLAPETLVKRFGAGRFLFGTDAPAKSPGAARGFFDWSGLPAADVRRITHGNLMEWLGLRRLPPVDLKPADDLVAAAWAGKPLEQVEVLDAHAHVNHEGCMGVGAYTQIGSGPSAMKRLFRSVGIRRTAVSSWLGIYPPEPRLGNDVTAEALRAEPDFIIGYACLDPVQLSDAEMRAEIELRYERQGFLGLKPYVNCSAAFDDVRYSRWYEYGNKRRLFALFHGSADAAGRIAAKYPRLQVILAHSAGSLAVAEANSAVALAHPNVFCEITLTPVANGAIERLVERLGARRVLFGTDAPMRDPRPQLAWAVHAAISRTDKEWLLGKAFAGILKACRKPGATGKGT